MKHKSRPDLIARIIDLNFDYNHEYTVAELEEKTTMALFAIHSEREERFEQDKQEYEEEEARKANYMPSWAWPEEDYQRSDAAPGL